MIRTFYRNVSPSAVLRAISAGDSTLPDDFAEDTGLAESLRSATDEEKAFGRKVADSAQLLRDWCNELDGWNWAGTFEHADAQNGHTGFNGTAESKQSSGRSGNHENGLHKDNVPSESRFSVYESRIHIILEELDALDMEQQKSLVLHAHQQADGLESNSASSTNGYPDHAHLDGLTALITATILTSLPYYARLQSFVEVWMARFTVLRTAPVFFARLDTTKGALEAAWELIDSSQDGEKQRLERYAYLEAREKLDAQLGGLGRTLDIMLDALEGRKDTLPDRWIDEVESLEENFTEWIVEAEGELSRIGSEHPADAHDNEPTALEHNGDSMQAFGRLENNHDDLRPAVPSSQKQRDDVAHMVQAPEEMATAHDFSQASSNEPQPVLQSSTPEQGNLKATWILEARSIDTSTSRLSEVNSLPDDTVRPLQGLGEEEHARIRGFAAPKFNLSPTVEKLAEVFEERNHNVVTQEISLPELEPVKLDHGTATATVSANGPTQISHADYDSVNQGALPALNVAPLADASRPSLATSTGDHGETNTQGTVHPESDEDITPSQDAWHLSMKSDSSIKDLPVISAPAEPIMSDSDMAPPRKGGETSSSHPHEDTFLIIPPSPHSTHRRNSSHEIIINKASLASAYSMSQVKRIDINRPAGTLHRRRSSEARLGGTQKRTDKSRHRVNKSEGLPSWSQRNSASYFLDPMPVAAAITQGYVPDLSSSPDLTEFAPKDVAQSSHLEAIVVPELSEKRTEAKSIADASLSGSNAETKSFSTVNREDSPQNTPAATTPPSTFFFPDENESDLSTPLTLSRPETPFSSNDDKLESKIDSILHSLPTKIDFKKRTRGPAKQTPLRQASRSRAASNGSNGSSSHRNSMERSQTPALTLSRADNQNGARPRTTSNRDSTIRLYHLMQTGKSAPIKLYVRLVGEDGERVMVRVGGGWADLAQYLRDYAYHHSRAIVPDPSAALQTLEQDGPGNTRAFSVSGYVDANRRTSGSSLKGSLGTRTPPSRPASRAQSRMVMVPTGGGGAALSIPKNRPLPTGSLRSVSAQPTIDVPAPQSRKNESSDEEADSPLLGASKLSEEKRKWLDGMLATARKHKAEKGLREAAAGAGATAGVVGKTKRVYRGSDGEIKLLDK